MDDGYDDYENEKLLIGNLLDEDSVVPPPRDVPSRSIPAEPPSFYSSTNLPWPNGYHSPTFDFQNWSLIPNNLNQWAVTPPTSHHNQQSFDFSENAEPFRYTPLSLSLNPPMSLPTAKPTATVFPFQTNYEINKSDDALSPVSDERTSDSGTISPDSRAKPIKWKKLDLSAVDHPKSEAYSRQNSESHQQQNGKSYSSVAQQHKRLSATSSVPLAKPQTIKQSQPSAKKTINTRSTRAVTQPTTSEDALPPKPSKIVGLNPINTNATPTADHQKAPIQAPIAAVPVNPDFQKIKRKKKGKAGAKKNDAKQADEQKSGSRYLALIQSSDPINTDDFLLENGPSEDEDEDDFDETEYQRQEEEEKEQIRQQARRQFANDKLPVEEANQKMEKLENDIKAIFEKRKTAKQQRSLRHRRRKTGYQLMIPSIVSLITSAVISGVYAAFSFFINLVANVLILSCHAFTDSSKALMYNFYQILCSFVLVLTEAVYKAARDSKEYIRQCGAAESQIGLPANSALPIYCEDVLERLYDCPNADAFSVLGLKKDATLDEIEVYFKRNVVLVNPDRKFNVGCEDAYSLLHQAHDLIGSIERRKEYLKELVELPQTYSLQVLLEEFRQAIDNKGALLHCDCNDNHSITRISPLSTYEGRFCVKCNLKHSVRNGDLWVERQYFGWVLTYYAVINNTVYDVSEWLNCGSHDSHKRPKPNSHMITHRLYNASTNASVTNVTEKHRCSCRSEPCDRCPRSSSTSNGFPKESLWKYTCCCSIAACPPQDSYPSNEIPCCFGGIFITINTTAAPITASEKLSDNDRARKAGRRRRYR